MPGPFQGGGALKIGARIADRYVVVRTLGEGGMGQVFEVEHEAIGRHFALKVLNINPCTEETLRRFRREARALGRVATPRVAQVTDFGVEPGVGPFYVMELLQGETLEARLEREHHLPLQEAIPIAIELCEALSEVHTTGIIHRDLKPSNVGLTKSGPVGIKLLDFGLAAAVDSESLERITRSREVVGSLPYMAPERFHNAPLTLSIDLYALGVVIFEMLTGELPFPGTNAAILINQHLNEPPRPFDEVAPGLDLPPSIEAVVMRLLDKVPAERFASAAAVARAIQAATIDAPIKTLTDEGGGGGFSATVLAPSDDLPRDSDFQDHIDTLAASKTAFADSEAGLSPGSAAPSAPPSPNRGIPTSVVPGAMASGGSWPYQPPDTPSQPPVSPTAPQGYPPAFVGQYGAPRPSGWVSESVPPATYAPIVGSGTSGRQWLRIATILLAGLIGSTLAAVLAVLLLWGDGSTREVPTVSPPRPIQPPSPVDQGQLPSPVVAPPPTPPLPTPLAQSPGGVLPPPYQPPQAPGGTISAPVAPPLGVPPRPAVPDAGASPQPEEVRPRTNPVVPSRPRGTEERPPPIWPRHQPPQTNQSGGRWQGGIIENPKG